MMNNLRAAQASDLLEKRDDNEGRPSPCLSSSGLHSQAVPDEVVVK